METPEAADPALAAARAAVLAEVQAQSGEIAPTLRPLSLNTTSLLYPPSAHLAAKLEARVQAGYELEGHDYPRSRTWSRVVVPAIAVASVDVPFVIGFGIAALLHVYLTWLIFLVTLIVFVAASAVAIIASGPALRDPLRLSTAERRELNQARSWQSRQPWMGPRSSTAEYRLFRVAHATVARLSASPAWASRYLDEHRLRLNLAAELDGIDQQACQLAGLRESRGGDPTLASAWGALVERVARLRHYADGVAALDAHVLQLDAAARAARLDPHVAGLAAGAALDEFAAEHVRALTADLHRLIPVSLPPVPPTSFATSRENAT